VQTANGVTLTGRAVTHRGGAGDDTLVGKPDNNVLAGEAGDDTIIGDGGQDLMFGGDGDDLFVLGTDTGFGHLDGGGGSDLVELGGSGISFDLTAVRGDQVNGIETVDITGSGDNVLVLDERILFAATGDDHRLIVRGDAGDTATAAGSWTQLDDTIIDGESYSVFASNANGATLLVDNDMVANVG
jgi:hypothetical protein